MFEQEGLVLMRDTFAKYALDAGDIVHARIVYISRSDSCPCDVDDDDVETVDIAGEVAECEVLRTSKC